jgi:D-Tyr-tRNAtyr deacylase
MIKFNQFTLKSKYKTGESPDYWAAEGATTQESLRQKDRSILTLERD